MTDKRTPTGRFRAGRPSLQNVPKLSTEDAERLVAAFRTKHPDLYDAVKEAFVLNNGEVLNPVRRQPGLHPALAAPYGVAGTATGQAFRKCVNEDSEQHWGKLTRAEIYASLTASIDKVADANASLVDRRLRQEWVIHDGSRVISYSPNLHVDMAVLLITNRLDNGVVEVTDSFTGPAATKQARYYLELHELRMKR